MSSEHHRNTLSPRHARHPIHGMKRQTTYIIVIYICSWRSRVGSYLAGGLRPAAILWAGDFTAGFLGGMDLLQLSNLQGPRARRLPGFSPRISAVSSGPYPAAPGSPSARHPGRSRLRPCWASRCSGATMISLAAGPFHRRALDKPLGDGLNIRYFRGAGALLQPLF